VADSLEEAAIEVASEEGSVEVLTAVASEVAEADSAEETIDSTHRMTMSLRSRTLMPKR
jgi:hypothetical protein